LFRFKPKFIFVCFEDTLAGMTRNFVSQICRKLLAFSVGHSNTRVVKVIAVFYFIQVQWYYHLFVEKLT
jgi:hypothetical protein